MTQTTSSTHISHLVVLGDSLSDRGTLNKRELLGLIPMSYLSGLSDKSPRGRFTNGFLWGDFVSATIAEHFEIDQVRRTLKLRHDARSNADIGDAFLSNTHGFFRKNEKAFRLNADKHVLYKGKRFARFNCEGGLTAHNYLDEVTLNPVLEFSRLILSHLKMKQGELLQEDKKYHVSQFEKKETLIVEWSGANDLITVNSEPTFTEVDKAVNARIKNIEALVQNGYRHFVLFNLPDLSLTPRFKAKSKEQQVNASNCSDYFNQQLAKKSVELSQYFKTLHIEINLSVFNVNQIFKKVYANPEHYEFDTEKLTLPYTQSEAFKKNADNPIDRAKHTSPAKGYMFWDDVHPTANMHALLAEQFKEHYAKEFDFKPPRHHVRKLKAPVTHLKQCDYSLHDKKDLPENLRPILKKLHTHADLMCQSTHSHRKEKGERLKLFIFELKCHNGSLEDIHGLIHAFTMNPENKKIIQKHQNPVFDSIFNKKTTHSEDLIELLKNTVAEHLNTASIL